LQTSAAFTYRGARSGALTAGAALALVIETVVLHLWLSPGRPRLAWTLSVLGVVALLYLGLEFRAWGRGAVRVTPEGIDLAIMGRVRARVARADVVSAIVAGWRDLPDGPESAYLNATSPAEPNVLLAFRQPVAVRVAGLVPRRVTRLGLRLDDPVAFIASITPLPHSRS
jgi:hypothetical protein